jgi:hypothetical protein
LSGDSVDSGRNLQYDTILGKMLRKNCYCAVLLALTLFLVVPARSQDKNTAPRLHPSQAQARELRALGALVGRGEAWGTVEKGWKSFLEKANDVDVDTAVNYVTQEASLEAVKNAEIAKKKLDQLNVLKGAVIEELSMARVVLADAQQRKKRTMINRKEFEVTQSEPFRIIVRSREVLSFEAEVAQYVRELEAHLRSIDSDVRRANAALGAMTQRRDDVMKGLPETTEKLLETGRRVREGASR